MNSQDIPKSAGPLGQAVADLSNSQAGLAQTIAVQMGKFSQWGAVGALSIGLLILIGGLLWSASQDRSQRATDNAADRKQTAESIKQVLDASDKHQADNMTMNNRQHDALIKGLEGRDSQTIKSIDRLADEIQGSRQMYQQQIAIEKERSARPPATAKGPDKPDGI